MTGRASDAERRPRARRLRIRDSFVIGTAFLGFVLSLALLFHLQPNEPPTIELVLPPAQLESLKHVRAYFGPAAEYDLITIHADAAISDSRLAEIENAIGRIPNVTRTWSSRSRPHLALTEEPEPTFVLMPGPPSPRDPQPLDAFLHPSPGTFAIWATLEARVAGLTEARRYCEAVDAALRELAQTDQSLTHTGTAALRVATWDEARRDSRRTLPWLLSAVLCVPLFFFRSWVAVLFPLLIAGLTSATLLGAYFVVVGRIDVWILVLFPLVWSVATMDALHLYESSSHAHMGGPRDAKGHLALPALVTAATTALSMLTLAFPGAAPLLRTFGLWGAAGTMLAYGYTFTVGGALLRVFPARPVPAWSSHFARRAVAAARRHSRLVLAAWLVVGMGAIFGIGRLRLEPGYTHIFAPGRPAGEAARALQRTFDAELVPFDVYLEATTPRQMQPDELLLATLGLQHYLYTLPETRLSLSAAMLVNEWARSDRRASVLMADPLFFDRLKRRIGPLAADPQIAQWLELDHGVARMQVLFRPMTFARKEELIGWITKYVANNTIGYRVTFGGPSYLHQVAEREGLNGIIWGIVADIALLAVILIALLRRARLVLVALLGNALPVVVLCGVMGLAGLPWSLDLLGLPVIVLGLAIDDTVHLLWPLRRSRSGEASGFQRSIRRYGAAVMATSVLLAVCLAGLSWSGFGVNRELGVLFPAGLLLALAAELTLVPAALAL